MTTTQHAVSFLGLGEMGSALARAALSAGHPTTVWNRSADKATALVDAGASRGQYGGRGRRRVRSHRGVPVRSRGPCTTCSTRWRIGLAGRRLINLTTTSPEGARELAAWAVGVGADYLDGGIMATPEMIGPPQSSILYSGSRPLYDDYLRTTRIMGPP